MKEPEFIEFISIECEIERSKVKSLESEVVVLSTSLFDKGAGKWNE